MYFVIDTTSRPAKPHGLILFSNADIGPIDSFVAGKVKGQIPSYAIVGPMETRKGEGPKKATVSERLKDKPPPVPKKKSKKS